MPKYTAKLVCPATATMLDPVKENLKVGQGQIAQVTVTWTPGSQWLNCLRILYEGGQIIPSEGAGFCRGDGYPDTWPEYIILDKPHPVLNLEAWNEGNDFEHEVSVSIIILPTVSGLEARVQREMEKFRRMVGI